MYGVQGATPSVRNRRASNWWGTSETGTEERLLSWGPVAAATRGVTQEAQAG